MNLFRRKPEPEPGPATAPALSELEIAEAAVRVADARIGAADKEFRELVERYQIRVDRNGRIASAVLPDYTKRDEIENLVRANLHARDKALAEFHRALSIWSGLKPEGGNHATSC